MVELPEAIQHVEKSHRITLEQQGYVPPMTMTSDRLIVAQEEQARAIRERELMLSTKRQEDVIVVHEPRHAHIYQEMPREEVVVVKEDMPPSMWGAFNHIGARRVSLPERIDVPTRSMSPTIRHTSPPRVIVPPNLNLPVHGPITNRRFSEGAIHSYTNKPSTLDRRRSLLPPSTRV
eukprot:NODE_3854_length_722_cov_76.151560_g3251_i0.p1 GENE.NODE_3854_length_722_cov_76.151560_g3251_i0~~NODE_3854_length_722_cov_76.151560_g3251_i0.p1  ORF type:complete len:195 (-),score=47.09 NODE_3854_length_722_cov_76.151560_g3251_i0:137-667(-)